MKTNKPIIETIINSAAIALAAFGTNFIIMSDGDGLLKGGSLIIFAVALEFIKYLGRQKKLW